MEINPSVLFIKLKKRVDNYVYILYIMFNINLKKVIYIMKTLVIHIEDPTTDFLKYIYKNIDCTIIRDGYSKDIIKAIKKHDRIIMCGHGGPSGLFGRRGNIISKNIVPYLRDKECIFIWCHANKFVEQHNLAGLYSGMFISEVAEAEMFGIITDEKSVEFSNQFFARMLGNCLKHNMNLKDSFKFIKENYVDDKDPVISYNNESMYYAEIEGDFLVSYKSMSGSVEIDDNFDDFIELNERFFDDYTENDYWDYDIDEDERFDDIFEDWNFDEDDNFDDMIKF